MTYRTTGGSRLSAGRSPARYAAAAAQRLSQESASISSSAPNQVAPSSRASRPSSQSLGPPQRRAIHVTRLPTRGAAVVPATHHPPPSGCSNPPRLSLLGG